VQLYSLREELQQNFEQTLENVVKAGYVGVEMAGLHGRSATSVAQLLKELNLQVSSMHADVLTEDGIAQAIEEAETLGCSLIVCPWVQPPTFSTLEGIQGLAAKLNSASSILAAKGKSLLYHNHDFEFQIVDGQPALFHLVKALDPQVKLELDLYWVAVGGADPVQTLHQLGERVGLVHVKDGHISPTHPMTAVGDGKLDYPAIVPAIPASVEWLIVELDACATDMTEAVTKSAHYLIEKGLGRGR
jgi:sugar phosphate isomerase/epimerase